ncbi:MAG: hypothetical protein U9Q91_06170 [Candidatus Marinimicrobia bacterium]|nr:hypothetical protein [Candidatus Neomarinimicrobiota bacterium]
MIKRILHIIIFILFLLPGMAAAQDIDSLLAILESHQDDEEWLAILSGETNYHLFYAQADYESNSYFAGRDIGLDQFNATLQATYSYKQFSTTLAGIFYEAFYPPLQATALSLNYRLPLKFPVDIDVNYGRYFFSSDTLTGSYPNSFGLGLSHNAGFWGANADFSLLTGSEGVVPQILTSAYGSFILYTWNKKNSISIRVEPGFYFGSETTALATAPGTWRAKIIGSGPGRGQGSGGGQTPETTYSTSFGLLNTEINFHLLVYLGDLDMTFTVRNNRPRSVDTEIAYAPTSLISFSTGYAFSFIGK